MFEWFNATSVTGVKRISEDSILPVFAPPKKSTLAIPQTKSIFPLNRPARFAILVPDEPKNPETPPRRRPRPRPARGR
ncbi:MAG: hypothetical protein MJ249_10230, partial [Kiritimatiellae bacterium]|nr:hypothetical protein [Kiritimatiellia bacterium]